MRARATVWACKWPVSVANSSALTVYSQPVHAAVGSPPSPVSPTRPNGKCKRNSKLSYKPTVSELIPTSWPDGRWPADWLPERSGQFKFSCDEVSVLFVPATSAVLAVLMAPANTLELACLSFQTDVPAVAAAPASAMNPDCISRCRGNEQENELAHKEPA
jgi:hypothetical protein